LKLAPDQKAARWRQIKVIPAPYDLIFAHAGKLVKICFRGRNIPMPDVGHRRRFLVF
jgi:hypothetical protein